MVKWSPLILLLILIIPLASARMCEEYANPGQSCTMVTPTITCVSPINYTYAIYNTTAKVSVGNLTAIPNNESVYTLEFNQTTAGNYFVILCEGSVREIYVRGTDQMSSVAIMLFTLSIAFGIIIASFLLKDIVHYKNPFVNSMINLLIRRALLVIGVFLLMFNSAIITTIAQFAGINLTQDLLTYTWLLGNAGYLLLLFMVISLIFEIKNLYKQDKERRDFED